MYIIIFLVMLLSQYNATVINPKKIQKESEPEGSERREFGNENSSERRLVGSSERRSTESVETSPETAETSPAIISTRTIAAPSLFAEEPKDEPQVFAEIVSQISTEMTAQEATPETDSSVPSPRDDFGDDPAEFGDYKPDAGFVEEAGGQPKVDLLKDLREQDDNFIAKVGVRRQTNQVRKVAHIRSTTTAYEDNSKTDLKKKTLKAGQMDEAAKAPAAAEVNSAQTGLMEDTDPSAEGTASVSGAENTPNLESTENTEAQPVEDSTAIDPKNEVQDSDANSNPDKTDQVLADNTDA